MGDPRETQRSAAATEAALAHYAELVREWAPRLDLVAPGDLGDFENRHIADSLRALPLLDEAPPGPGLDVGSGAGLPGIPLAIVSSGRDWRLLEPRRRRAGFLDEVIRELDLRCEVVTMTAQEAARSGFAGSHAIALARALAPPPEAFEVMLPLLLAGGIAAVFVGSGATLPPGASLWRTGIARMDVPATATDIEGGIPA